MSHKSALRVDKTCLNCNHVVADRFCPNCGQENTESRKTFYHLFFHFFEDLTHYENAFWKTIKNLILRPASLTKEYLSGKRLSYLAPVRLYIFISFVTFFLISLFPSTVEEEIKSEKNKTEESQPKKTNNGFIVIKDKEVDDKKTDTLSSQELKLKNLLEEGKLTKKEFDTLSSYTKESNERASAFSFNGQEFKSLKEMDSIQEFSKKKMSPFKYWIARKLMKATHKKKSDEIMSDFVESFKHNIPKALFVYMPLFAFLLWLFHNKKKWYYFDHGIFTLHYFSFMLLVILMATFLIKFIYLFGENGFTETIDKIISLIIPFWFIYYFYKAHKVFYQESKVTSFIKSSFLLVLNSFFMFFVLLFFIIYSFINIH